MKHKSILILLTIFCFLFLFQQKGVAQEKSGGPAERYVVKENGGLANDFVVVLRITLSNSWRVVARTEQERRVLARSSCKAESNGRIMTITCTTGFRARKFAAYGGSIDE